jgi:predicted CoA-binding protein
MTAAEFAENAGREKRPLPSLTISPMEVLKRYRVVAVVGASRNPEKDAHTVPEYLKEHGFTLIPINPGVREVLGEKAYPSLFEIPAGLAREVQVVDVFRPSEELPRVAEQVVIFSRRFGASPVFWAQLGLESEEAKEILSKNDIRYVMNACMRATYRMGEFDHDLA